MPAPKSSSLKNPQIKVSRFLFIFCSLFLVISFMILFLTYKPVAEQEIKYYLSRFNRKQNEIKPRDLDFGIVIPRINVNASIIKNVDPYLTNEYQQALVNGVAHTKKTGLPGEGRNIFIFAHSSGNFYQANHYNSVFYLLHKLVPGDSILLFFNQTEFSYKVRNIAYVEETEMSYLQNENYTETLTLMTCWPPGTTLKRLIVTADKSGY